MSKTIGYTVIKLEEDQTVKQAVSNETDEQIIERMRERFEMLEDMTRAAKKGQIRALIVSGAPGVGKSFGVDKVLAREKLISDIGNFPPKYEVVKGTISAIGLYAKLYHFSSPKNVLVFDDCDDIFEEVQSLNILKSALDTSKQRWISWAKDSRLLRREGIPDRFEFKGSAIFITNDNFSDAKGKKLQQHLKALESRCHYLDLTIHTEREKMLRIKQIVDAGMLKDYNFSDTEVAELLEFVTVNKKRFTELSLRTVIKLADLKVAFGQNYPRYAEMGLMK